MFVVWTWFSWIFVHGLPRLLLHAEHGIYSLLPWNFYIILPHCFPGTVWQTSLNKQGKLLSYAADADSFMGCCNDRIGNHRLDYIYFFVVHMNIGVVRTAHSTYTQQKELHKGMITRSEEPLGSPLVTTVIHKFRVYFCWEICNFLRASKSVFTVNVCELL